MPPVETFPALAQVPGIIHGFTGRIPDLDVKVEREEALRRLERAHAQLRADLGLAEHHLIVADQVHGSQVVTVDRTTTVPAPATDGIMTNDPQVCLGVYVADCGPVFLVDPVKRVGALLHSGRKGTELGITTVAIRKMVEEFGSVPSDLIVQLGPCIRAPLYEIDFASEIIRQAKAEGVREVHDCGICTGTNVERYYSYRVEKGRTGRLLALLAVGRPD